MYFFINPIRRRHCAYFGSKKSGFLALDDDAVIPMEMENLPAAQIVAATNQQQVLVAMHIIAPELERMETERQRKRLWRRVGLFGVGVAGSIIAIVLMKAFGIKYR
eukprot:scpid109587/ scgid34242/ 